jgi:hypothetical protein
VAWTDLAQDTDKWRYLVNIVSNVGFHKMLGNYRMATQNKLPATIIHGLNSTENQLLRSINLAFQTHQRVYIFFSLPYV